MTSAQRLYKYNINNCYLYDKMHIITNAASIHVCYKGLIGLPSLSGINIYDIRGIELIDINKCRYCSV